MKPCKRCWRRSPNCSACRRAGSGCSTKQARPTWRQHKPSRLISRIILSAAQAFSLVACDLGPDCITLSPELKLACAHGGYCDAQTFEELYQNFLASPWAYSTAMRYRSIIYNAIDSHDWSLIGLQPKASFSAPQKSSYVQKSTAMRSSIFSDLQ